MRSPLPLLFATATILAGCAGTYTVKPGEPVAYVRFSTNAPSMTVFSEVPPPGCADVLGNHFASFTSLSGKQLSDVRMLGSSGQPRDDSVDRLVAAGQRLLVLARSSQVAVAYSPGYSCSMGLEVTFKPEHHYEMAFELLPSQCKVHVWELTDTPSGIQKREAPNTHRFPARYTRDFCGR